MTTSTTSVSYMRQSAILDPERAATTHITIAGCGTVGSNAAMQLARAGFKRFHLIDMDQVEPHNLPSQHFDVTDLGANKAAALAEGIVRITDNTQITTQEHELIGGEQFDQGILISAVDSMDMRKMLFEMSAVPNPLIDLFVDFRMGGNEMRAWAFNPQDKRRADQYAKTLHGSEESAEALCGGRTFAPMGALVGAICTQFITKHLRDEDHPPFHLFYDFDRFTSAPIGLPKRED